MFLVFYIVPVVSFAKTAIFYTDYLRENKCPKVFLKITLTVSYFIKKKFLFYRKNLKRFRKQNNAHKGKRNRIFGQSKTATIVSFPLSMYGLIIYRYTHSSDTFS